MARRRSKKQARTLTSTVEFGEVAVDQHLVSDTWWMLLVRGISLTLFGLFAVLWPGITLLALATGFGVYLLIRGGVELVTGARSIGHHNAWFLKVVLGILEIMAGIYILDRGTLLVITTFILLLGLFFIFEAIVDVVTMFSTSRDFGSWVWMLLVALLSFVAGVVILRQPATGALAFTWVLGFYGIFGGALTIGTSLGMRPKK